MTVIKGQNVPTYGMQVDKFGRGFVHAITSPNQHFMSDYLGEHYQVDGEETPASGTVNVLHIQNTDTQGRLFVIEYIRLQVIDNTAGAAADYFTITTGELWSSGGDAVTPTNMNFGSGNTAVGSFYENGPTLSGTATEFERWYPAAEGEVNTFDKEGAVIIPPGKAITIKYTSDQAAGAAYARVSFFVRLPLRQLLEGA